MKSVFLLSLMSFSISVWAIQEWRVVAEATTSCDKKLKVLAKEGEKFVYVTDGDYKTKLFSEDGTAFSEVSGKAIVFSNTADKSLKDGSKKFTFFQPSMVDGNPPKLNSASNGIDSNCKMKMR